MSITTLPVRRVVALLAALSVLSTATPSLALPPGALPIPAPDAVEDCIGSPEPQPAWAAGLTPAADTRVEKVERWIERPDGTLLEVTVYLPMDHPAPYPTVLYYTPYSSAFLQAAGWEELDGDAMSLVVGPVLSTLGVSRPCSGYYSHWAPFFLRRGYAFVVADIRGTGDSTGCYNVAGPDEQADGRAIVDWIAAQAWSDGTVGMHGMSLEGLSQLATAIAAPPALKAIIPTSASAPYETWRPGGISHDDPYGAQTPPLVRAGVACDPEAVVHLNGLDGTMGPWWQSRYMPSHAHKIQAAVLLPVGNPYDTIFGFGPLWAALEAAGVPRKGLVGPWGHEYPAVPWWELHELRWFEHHLRGIDTGVMGRPALTLIDRTGRVTRTNSLERPPTGLSAADGTLTRKGGLGTATYTDRPGAPRVVIEADPSAHLRYDTAPFARDTHLTGTPRLDLVATIDQADANFIAMLYDVAPDGSKRYVTRGFLDALLRDGLDQPSRPVPPGVAQTYRIQLWPRHHLILAGHRLELVVSSSDACYDCPQPDAEEYFPWTVRSDPLPATVIVHEGPKQTTLWLPLQTVAGGGPAR